jgi:twitching motility protein PilT
MAEIDRWLGQMLDNKASDLHLRAGAPPMWRIHGEVSAIPGEGVLESNRLGKIMREISGDVRWRRFLQKLDLDFAYALGDDARFRVNYLHQNLGYGCVLRQIPAKVLTLEDLKAPLKLRDLPHLRSGLVLVTGPTGSGKSTTLAAVVDEINRNYHRHIITIEDPIEFVHQNLSSIVTQREVGTDTPEFAQALKDSLREDPDVILVGEMRDLETIALAITLSETGVLVFATLHTNTAAKTIDRIIDVFPAGRQQQVRTMLSTSLRAIVAQQLLRRADGSGRIAAHEILVSSTGLAHMIREGHSEKIPSYIQSGREMGMTTMDNTLQNYLKVGLITGHDAYMYAQDKSLFQKFFKLEEKEEEEEEKEGEKASGPAAAGKAAPAKGEPAKPSEKEKPKPPPAKAPPVKPAAAPEAKDLKKEVKDSKKQGGAELLGGWG